MPGPNGHAAKARRQRRLRLRPQLRLPRHSRHVQLRLTRACARGQQPAVSAQRATPLRPEHGPHSLHELGDQLAGQWRIGTHAVAVGHLLTIDPQRMQADRIGMQARCTARQIEDTPAR